MSRVLQIGVVLAVLPGCATTVTPRAPRSVPERLPVASEVQGVHEEWLVPAALVVPAAETSTRSTDHFTLPALSSAPAGSAAPAEPLPDDDDDGTNYLTAKAGWLFPEDSDLDDGYLVNFAYGRYFTRLLAVEFEGGYLQPDPDFPSSDLYQIPLLVNARVNLPILFFEVYGGGGVGGMYYNLDIDNVLDSDGWLFAADLFLGADIALFDLLTAGLELKYYFTEEIDRFNEDLNALALMLTAGLRF